MCKILVSQEKQKIVVAPIGSAIIFSFSVESRACAGFVFLCRDLGILIKTIIYESGIIFAYNNFKLINKCVWEVSDEILEFCFSGNCFIYFK